MLKCRIAYIGLFAFAVLIPDVLVAQPLPLDQQKTGDAVLRAFQPVVKQATQSTASILLAGQPAAFGVVVGADGWVLTKASDVYKQGNDGQYLPIKCRIQGKTVSGNVIGIHRENDLAIVKVAAKNLTPIDWNTGKDPAVGAWLATTGTGELPVAVGVVSVGRRNIAPGRGMLGISLSTNKNQAKITKVTPNSGAARAGMKVGDVIIGMAGGTVKTQSQLSTLLESVRPGDAVRVRVERDGSVFDLIASLSHRVDSFFSRRGIMNQMGGGLSVRRGGFKSVIQHDTVLQPSQCGGPLVDLSGKCVGINIARSGRTETFTLPASEILPLLAKLKSGELAPPKPSVVLSRPAPPPLPE
ncbi:MAG: PDZ domain-containing protein [Planctomycetota bacterium]|nr:PDZ domain-containing protein [Planctomycetota bacterium]